MFTKFWKTYQKLIVMPLRWIIDMIINFLNFQKNELINWYLALKYQVLFRMQNPLKTQNNDKRHDYTDRMSNITINRKSKSQFLKSIICIFGRSGWLMYKYFIAWVSHDTYLIKLTMQLTSYSFFKTPNSLITLFLRIWGLCTGNVVGIYFLALRLIFLSLKLILYNWCTQVKRDFLTKGWSRKKNSSTNIKVKQN